jgi:hypothetical protein
VGRQSAKDTPTTTTQFFPVTSLGLNMNQNTQALPAEIGGDYFLRNSYKASVIGGGDTAMVVRPNSFGNLLYMLAGQDTVTPVPSQSGAYSHSFVPFAPSAGVDLPWFTFYKDVSKFYAEQHLNTKLRSLRIDIPKASIVTAQASVLSTTPSTVTIASLGTETFDTTPQFQTCVATVTLAAEAPSPSLTFPVNLERFSLNYTNVLSEDEYAVGSYYVQDSSLLQRTVTVDMDFVLRDTTLIQAAYLNGATIPNAWSPQIYRGALNVQLNSNTNIGATTQPYQLNFNFPGLDFLMAPITLSGAELIRSTLSTQVTLGTGDRFAATLINGVSTY